MNCLAKSFELSSCAAACTGPNTFNPAAQGINHACRQRRFRADHGELNAFFQRERNQFRNRSNGDVFQPLFRRRAAVAGRDIDLLDARRLLESPGQRMFASAGTDDEEFHD